jgi:hypothetical protein
LVSTQNTTLLLQNSEVISTLGVQVTQGFQLAQANFKPKRSLRRALANNSLNEGIDVCIQVI